MTEISKQELELIVKKIAVVKKAGYGSLLIKVQDGAIVYITQEIGEQVRMELEPEK